MGRISKKVFLWAFVFFSISLTKEAFSASAPYTNEQLTTIVLRLEGEMNEMHQTIDSQNQTIQTLRSQLEEQKIPVSTPKEPEKQKTFQENVHDYVFGKPVSLPSKDEKKPVLAGMGNIETSLLIQEWYTDSDTSGPSGATKDNFRTRRAELGFGGKLMDDLSWKLVADPSLVREDNTTRSILKDAYVEYKAIPHHTLKLGQYKIPVTEEGFRSSAKIDTVERSFIGRTFGDKRDVGLMALGDWKYLDYQIGVFNGNESNNFDTNDQKDIVGRFVLTPFPDNSYLKGLELGTSMYHRATNETATEKKRIGAEARYEYGPFSLKSEYMHAQDAVVPASGWYLQTGYFFLPRWQGIFRFEGFDPNERASDDRENDITAGLNYFLVYPTTKLQLQYTRRNVDGGTDDDQVLAGAQYAF